MRLLWRRCLDEPDHEFVLLIASTAPLLAAIGWLAMSLPWPRCPFLALTGWPCLTCGATRSLIALVHGDLRSALQWNPLVFVAFLILIAFDLYAVIVLIGRLPRLRIVNWTIREKKLVRVAIVVLLVINWAYLLAHRDQF